MNISSLSPAEAAHLILTPEYADLLRVVPHGLIIDMDDTLNSNGVLFSHSTEALLDIYALLGYPGEDRESHRDLHLRVDRANLPEMGFTPARWLHTAQQVGSMVARRPLTLDEQERVRQAAMLAMGPGELLEGVPEALRALSASGLPVVLKTKGELAKQQEKIVHHALADHFAHIEIVPKKDASSFEEVARRYRLPSPVSIGDRYAADIAPALACGMRGILVGDTTDWEHDESVDDARAQSASCLAAALVLLADEQR